MYRCSICNTTYEKRIKVCKKCKSEVKFIEKETSEKQVNAVFVDDQSLGIERDNSKCINCGMCTNTCYLRENLKNNKNFNNCLECGQCIQTCPTGALKPKCDIPILLNNLNKKVCIALVAPAVRVSIGDEFNKDYGSFEQEKLVGILRKLGFDYVFDVTYGADLTIVEEAYELVDRIKTNKNLPMLSSCCPSWVLYAERYYPELLNHLSTCKSPISMLSEIINSYFIPKKNLNREDVFVVALTPCTSKKYEIKRKELKGTDLVITTSELSDLIKLKKYNYDKIKNSNFDYLFKEGSGSGVIFGTSGGVTESVIRMTYNILTGDSLKEYELHEVRGLENVKEANFIINGKEINVAVVNGLSNVKRLLEQIKKKKSKYEFIEVMNCFGGCIGGGGQIKMDIYKEALIKNARSNSLYNRDKVKKIKSPYQNKDILELYSKYIGKPYGKKAEKLLHTVYFDKSKEIKR